jgi:hypothetical protein
MNHAKLRAKIRATIKRSHEAVITGATVAQKLMPQTDPDYEAVRQLAEQELHRMYGAHDSDWRADLVRVK